MRHPLFKKIIIWSLLIVGFGSFGCGTGRAVICLGQNGEATLELLHSGNDNHCLDEHLLGRHHNRQREQKDPISTIKRNRCNACDDFEVSLQLYAPRNEPAGTIINFIAKPQFAAGIKLQLPQPVNTISHIFFQPPTINPALTHLKSIILLI